MAELKLFKLGDEIKELKSSSATIEKELQNTIEKNMYKFLVLDFYKVNIELIMVEWIL